MFNIVDKTFNCGQHSVMHYTNNLLNKLVLLIKLHYFDDALWKYYRRIENI